MNSSHCIVIHTETTSLFNHEGNDKIYQSQLITKGNSKMFLTKSILQTNKPNEIEMKLSHFQKQ